MSLKSDFLEIVYKYIRKFEKKHDIEFLYFVADNVDICVFGDFFLNFEDIRYDIDNNIDPYVIFKWYDESVEKAAEDDNFMNFQNYCKLKSK